MDKKTILLEKIKEIKKEKQSSKSKSKPKTLSKTNKSHYQSNNNHYEQKKILLYDPDEKDLTRTKLFLIKNQYSVNTTKNRTHFYELLKENSYNLLIINYLKDTIKTKELVKRIKLKPRLNKLPIIIITNSSNKEDVIFFFKYQVKAYLLKPIQYPKLLQKIKEIFDQTIQKNNSNQT